MSRPIFYIEHSIMIYTTLVLSLIWLRDTSKCKLGDSWMRWSLTQIKLGISKSRKINIYNKTRRIGIYVYSYAKKCDMDVNQRASKWRLLVTSESPILIQGSWQPHVVFTHALKNFTSTEMYIYIRWNFCFSILGVVGTRPKSRDGFNIDLFHIFFCHK